jgi:hypothetical protein
MDIEIGQLTGNLSAPVWDLIPTSPPALVLAEIDAAWERGAELAAENRELHFGHDADGHLIIEVRSLDGDVFETISAAHALDVMSGAAL